MDDSTTSRTILSVKALEEAVAMLFQNNFDTESKVCLLTLIKMLDNLLQQPGNQKFRTIRLNNSTFQEKVGSRKGGMEILLACGFVRQNTTTALSSTTHEATLVLEREDQSHLILARRLLATRAVQDLGIPHEQLPPWHNPPPPLRAGHPSARPGSFNPYVHQRFDAASAAIGANLGPDANYVSKTETELQRLIEKQTVLERKLQATITDREWMATWPGQDVVQRATTAVESSTSGGGPTDSSLLATRVKKQMEERNKIEHGSMTTAAMRQVAKLKEQKVYSHTLLTIQFSDGCKLTGKFLPKERISAVMQGICECLVSDHDFELYVAPPRRVLPLTQSLQQEGLVPAAKIFASWKASVPPTTKIGSYLKPHLFGSGTTAAFPSAQPIVGPDTSTKPEAATEEALLRRMMGRGGGRSVGPAGANTKSDDKNSKKPKWFKG